MPAPETAPPPAPGLERVLLRKLPWLLLFGTLVPVLWSVGLHLDPPLGDADAVAKALYTSDLRSLGLVVAVWMGALTIAIGCVFVIIMKGPRHTADSYEIPDGDAPRPRRRRD